MTMAPWAAMLAFVETYTRVGNVICDHRVARSGNWQDDLPASTKDPRHVRNRMSDFPSASWHGIYH